MPYFQFDQNNSGGFYTPETPHHVIVKAANPDEANRIAASRTPVYFDGVDRGLDCFCCGDRWTRAWEEEIGTPKPMVYDALVHPDGYVWMHNERLDVLVYEGE